MNLGIYGGVIADTGQDWLELAPGWEGEGDTRYAPADERARQKPKRISTEGTTVGGNPGGEGEKAFTHRLADVRVGDRVTINSCGDRNGREWTLGLEITRRPGGRIPPMADAMAVTLGSHLRNQAEQDWEEKGAPIPAKYLDPQGRAPWTNPPYPPVAPLPRPKGK